MIKINGSYVTGTPQFKLSGAYSAMAQYLKSGGVYSQIGNVRTPLRAASLQNHILSDVQTKAGATECWVRWQINLGASCSSLVLSNLAWYMGPTGPSASSGFTIVEAAIEKNLVGYVPVTHGGNRSLSVTSGANDLQSDPIVAPVSFGSVFDGGGSTYYWIRMRLQFPAGTSIPYAGGRATTHSIGSDCQVLWIDPLVTTMTNPIDSIGAFTYTGTAPQSSNGGYCPITLGAFVDQSTKSYFALGDSILGGLSDQQNRGLGAGPFQRALYGAGGNAIKPGLNFSRPGSFASSYTNQFVYQYAQYTDVAVTEWGTNDFGSSGTAITYTALASTLAMINNKLREGGVLKIVRTKLGPRTTGAWTLADLSDQVYAGAGWQSGGNVDLFNQWVDSAAGTAGNHDLVCNWADMHSSVDYWKWPANGSAGYGTTDGIHPWQVTINTPMGADLRAVLLSAS